MNTDCTRRRFLGAGISTGVALGMGDWTRSLPPVLAADARLPTGMVRFRPQIEPLVRVLEETPRERLLEEVARRIRAGLSYRELLAALFLAGIRNVQPRPSVGFKFHAVLVVNAAHLASLSSPASDRWLPIFWALDEFKSSQARDVEEGNWTMAAVDEARVPGAGTARSAFIDAMDRWDEEAADAAVAGLARTTGAHEIFELFFRYGCRDFRSIGHKAIFVAGSLRTLEVIGWEHAEPVLRSLAYALLNHEGESPASRDALADRPWRENAELARSVRSGWEGGRVDTGATVALLDALRHGKREDAPKVLIDALQRGVSPTSLWDALLTGSTELLMRRNGIVALHAVTTTNALHHAYWRSSNDDTRRMLLLQSASFLPLFRQEILNRGQPLADVHLDDFAPSGGEDAARPELDDVFDRVGVDNATAAAKALAYLDAGGRANDLIAAARVLIFRKGTDAHDYKFSSAVLEDYAHVSPEWRDRFLAASVYQLRGSRERDNPLVERARAALAT